MKHHLANSTHKFYFVWFAVESVRLELICMVKMCSHWTVT